ncbi:hypothetical protein [Clostridium gasigenes]|uniref:hypothetical protein n=1 Tax=Clostridium gasigenes TaxID=94869 RepID=UPI001C0BC4B4|nr:hypothetical protein [Clostridium gasigenes]MBU3107179.1 hypothetical protein [Clostridium gasigenes]
MLLNRLTELKKCCTNGQFQKILDKTTSNIKLTKIGCGKCTSQIEFQNILNNTANIILGG